MNKSIAIVLSTVSLSAFASSSTVSPEVPDQVVASFDRLLNHQATSIAVMAPALPKADPDPLRAGVNAVLWEQHSYHLPVKYAFHDVKEKQTN